MGVPPRTRPMVSIVMPVMNEASRLDAALAGLRGQTYPADRIEILAVDGGSTDGTVDLLEREAAADPRIRPLGGPGVNTPAALNIGIANARGEIVAYVGGHGHPDPRFLELAVDRLESDARLGCVGGLIIPAGDGETARAAMIARFSVFGVGRGIYTTDPTVHEIETVQWGVYRKDAVEQAGLFDPELQFGEDEELNYRLRRAGFRILYDPALRMTYYARSTFRGLFRQYRNYGRARVRVLRKHPEFLRPKHVVPGLVVATLAGAAALPIVARRLWPLSALVAATYGSFVAVASVVLARRERFSAPHRIAAGLASLHVGYGIGTLLGLVDLVRRR